MRYKGKEIKVAPQEINDKLDELLVNETFGSKFKFRPHQRKAVVKICFLYLNKICKNVILDAPTGSGKSIIAIITSKLLRSWKARGYIITSNLDLQEQYQKDLRQYELLWGSIKGMRNYDCDTNGKIFPLGECKIRNLSKDTIENLGCYQTCGYFMNRLRAIASAVSILNYSYWLIQRNYVVEKQKFKNEVEHFKKRDFIFFDEAHKIDDIVQSHFSVTLNQKLLERVAEIVELLDEEEFLNTEIDLPSLMLDYSAIMDEDSFDENMVALRNFKKVLSNLALISPEVRAKINKKYPMNSDKEVPKRFLDLLQGLEILKDVNCKIEDYIEIVERKPDTFVKTLKDNDQEVTYNLLDDVDLVQKKLHKHSNFSIFMSATLGNPDMWAQLTGTTDYEVITVPDNWNHQKSPIIITHSGKLSFAKKKESWPSIVKKFDQILNKHKNEKGIVHTGNFGFTKQLLIDSVNTKRLYTYNNTREKIAMMPRFKKSKNGVLIGPSLMEGLDLPDDMSRFQIFLKVPYRQITDNYIKQKMRYDERWYNWKTAIAFTQGIGRSIRNDNDWAVTYLLDGCFKDFIRYNSKSLHDKVIQRMIYES